MVPIVMLSAWMFWLQLQSALALHTLTVIEQLDLTALKSEVPFYWWNLYIDPSASLLRIETMPPAWRRLIVLSMLFGLSLVTTTPRVPVPVRALLSGLLIFSGVLLYVLAKELGLHGDTPGAQVNSALLMGVLFFIQASCLLHALWHELRTRREPSKEETQRAAGVEMLSRLMWPVALGGAAIAWWSASSWSLVLERPSDALQIQVDDMLRSREAHLPLSELQSLRWRYQLLGSVDGSLWYWTLSTAEETEEAPYKARMLEDGVVLSFREDVVLKRNTLLRPNSPHTWQPYDYAQLEVDFVNIGLGGY